MDKLPIRQPWTFKRAWPYIKNTIMVVFVIGLVTFISALPNATNVDFAIMRKSLSNYGTRQRETDGSEEQGNVKNKIASATIALEKKQQEERKRYVNESRARMFVESATHDYYRGCHDDALRRLDRARIYDPCNFSAFKLTGQIFFEHNLYRKAFNNWERANQLPNDDKTIARDLDVLRKLLRYSRNEIDKLRQTVNTKPEDRIAKARLKELEERVGE